MAKRGLIAPLSYFTSTTFEIDSTPSSSRLRSRLKPQYHYQLLFFLFATEILTPQLSRAEYFTTVWQSHRGSDQSVRLVPRFSSYSSSKNYSPYGILTVPNSLVKNTRMTGSLEAEFSGFIPSTTVYGRGSWGYAKVAETTKTGSAYGFTDQMLGLNIAALNSVDRKFALEIQAEVNIPTYSNTSANISGKPFLGDGSLDVTGGISSKLQLTKFSLNSSSNILRALGSVGYTLRNSGFSSHVPWSAGLDLSPLTHGLKLQLLGYGITSLRTDAKGALAFDATNDQGGIGASGSYFVNAVNPSFVAIKGQLGYQLDKNLALLGDVSQTLWGRDAPYGLQFGFLVSLQLDTASKPGAPPVERVDASDVSPEKIPSTVYGKDNQGFVQYTLEAKVLKTNDKLSQLKIDKGTNDGVGLGQVFDVFSPTTNEPVARAKVVAVKNTDAQLQVTDYYQEIWIEEGFSVRKPIQ